MPVMRVPWLLYIYPLRQVTFDTCPLVTRVYDRRETFSLLLSGDVGQRDKILMSFAVQSLRRILFPRHYNVLLNYKILRIFEDFFKLYGDGTLKFKNELYWNKVVS